MRIILALSLLLALPANAADVRSIGPWFVSTVPGAAGPVTIVGQIGRALGFDARCNDHTDELHAYGIGEILDLHFGRPIQMRISIDGQRPIDLTGIAVERNRAVFIQDVQPAIDALRAGQTADITVTDSTGATRRQQFSLSLKDRAFRSYMLVCPSASLR
jgi:hypothetical protein